MNPDSNGCIFVQVPPGSTPSRRSAHPAAGSFTDYSGAPAFVTPSGPTTDETRPTRRLRHRRRRRAPPAFDEGIIANVAYGGPSAVDSGVECPGAAAITCVTTGTRTSGRLAAWGGAGATWTTANTVRVTQINQVACTTAASPTASASATDRPAVRSSRRHRPTRRHAATRCRPA